MSAGLLAANYHAVDNEAEEGDGSTALAGQLIIFDNDLGVKSIVHQGFEQLLNPWV